MISCGCVAHQNENIFADMLSQLDLEIGTTIAAAWSRNTQSTQNSQWRQFFSFCKIHGLEPLPASELTLARFLLYKARSTKYSTINNYLSAVCVLHKFYGHEVTFRSSYFITMVMEGLRHRLGDGVKQSQPLSVQQLMDMYAYVDKSNTKELLMWGVIVVSFGSLLRKSNIVPDKVNEISSHVVRRADVMHTDFGLCLNIYSTKTLKYREKVLDIPLVRVEGSPLCAVKWIEFGCRAEVAEKNMPLFMWQGKPIIYRDVLYFIKRLVKGIGMDPNVIGLHSLRRSGTQFLHGIGVSLPDIKSMGAWKTMSVLMYLISSPDRKVEIDRLAAQELAKL